MVASRIALAWARVYTCGVPGPSRQARLDELASDMWEHAEDGLASSKRPAAVQLEIASRVVRGAAADVSWRCSQRSLPARAVVLRGAGWTAFVLGTAFMLTLTSSSGAPTLGVYSVEGWGPGEARENARVMSALFVGLVSALALLRRFPRTGLALLAAACLGLTYYAAWMWPVLVPCSVACLGGALALTRRRRAEPLGDAGRRTLLATVGITTALTGVALGGVPFAVGAACLLAAMAFARRNRRPA